MPNFVQRLSALSLGAFCFATIAPLLPEATAQETGAAAIAELDKALATAKESSSSARQRLGVRRAIRDAEELLAAEAGAESRYAVLEFLFRAHQQLIAIDDDPKYRAALLETARELVKAPDEQAALRLEADLLLSQADLAKKGAGAEARAEALRPFVDRYLETPVAAKVLRLAMVMALELGDNRLVTDLQEMIERRFAADLEMISFQRDKLGGQVFGAPFTGTFERSDGKTLCFPMDGLGRSTMLVFWSKENGGEDLLKGLASAFLENKDQLAGRLELISVNLDELPDAGESFVRGLGVDWQVLRLPGGRKHPIFDPYVRYDPRILTVNPTGYTALIMSGSTRKRPTTDGTPDYGRMFGSAMARSWTQPRYVAHLSSLMAGDFLVLDPDGGIDPTLPPELKASAADGAAKPLERNSASVPEDTLRAIQDCFVAPPRRYRLEHAEARSAYAKAEALCRKAIAEHPEAPDLWIVRNRLIVALLGLWKTDADLAQLEKAVAEAKTALAAGYPQGCDVVARFCVAREALRDPAADRRAIVGEIVSASASGPALAAAALLSLDVADRASFEEYRAAILKSHTEHPMMWTFTSFLLDRYHNYWMFQVPFVAGWSYGRRADYFMTRGDREETQRTLRTELKTLEGEAFRIPGDLEGESTAIVFAVPGPYSAKRDDGLPGSPERFLKTATDFSAARSTGDVKVLLAVLSDDADLVRRGFGEKEVPCPVLMVPGGMDNPLLHRLGILSEDTELNSVLLQKDGRIIGTVSGLAKQSSRGGTTLTKLIQREDEAMVSAALESGDVEKAKGIALALAPPFDPEAVDERGRKLKPPQYSNPHLRSRARVYMALGDWDAALKDIEEVIQKQTARDAGMSLRTDELDQAEALRDMIREKAGGATPGGS